MKIEKIDMVNSNRREIDLNNIHPKSTENNQLNIGCTPLRPLRPHEGKLDILA